MLELINFERKRAGVGPVLLGDNNAAQLHTESALENCFASHWGMDGLKPNHRYSLAGGHQANAENAHGLDYCIEASDRIRPITSVRDEIKEAVEGWMSSPGHRQNMLDPLHRRVNIGIAWDRYNEVMYQHFEGDYVDYAPPPSLVDGILTLRGKVKNGVDSYIDLGVQIFYDPAPHPLTVGQLSRTYCYDSGLEIANLRKPLTGNSFYPTHQETVSATTCPNPYDVPPDAPPARSASEALSLLEQAHNKVISRQTITFKWVAADLWTVTVDSFSVRANLSELLEDYGEGIYSVNVWGKMKGGKSEVISKLTFFYRTSPPDTYDPARWEQQTPAPTATRTPTPTRQE